MKKLSMFLALLVTVLMFAFVMTPPPAYAEEITTTTTIEEETTTTAETTEEITTTIGWEEEIDLAFETAKNAVIAFVTSLFGTAMLAALGKVVLDKTIKAFTAKVRDAEAQNKISSERADQLVTAMNVAQTAANQKIDELAQAVEEFKAENVALHGDVSALLAELQERELRIAELLETVLGTAGEDVGEE